MQCYILDLICITLLTPFSLADISSPLTLIFQAILLLPGKYFGYDYSDGQPYGCTSDSQVTLDIGVVDRHHTKQK